MAALRGPRRPAVPRRGPGPRAPGAVGGRGDRPENAHSYQLGIPADPYDIPGSFAALAPARRAKGPRKESRRSRASQPAPPQRTARAFEPGADDSKYRGAREAGVTHGMLGPTKARPTKDDHGDMAHRWAISP